LCYKASKTPVLTHTAPANEQKREWIRDGHRKT